MATVAYQWNDNRIPASSAFIWEDNRDEGIASPVLTTVPASMQPGVSANIAGTSFGATEGVVHLHKVQIHI